MSDHQIKQSPRLIAGYKLPRGETGISLWAGETVVIPVVNQVIILLIERAIEETERRRAKQEAYNKAHGIVPKTIEKKVVELIKLTKVEEDGGTVKAGGVDSLKKLSEKALQKQVKLIEKNMKAAAKQLDFELAAEYRDQMILIKGEISKRHERK